MGQKEEKKKKEKKHTLATSCPNYNPLSNLQIKIKSVPAVSPPVQQHLEGSSTDKAGRQSPQQNVQSLQSS